jgi:uncharacterized membrane protein YsdA (DUF1294 family)/cold shock CspA family protein
MQRPGPKKSAQALGRVSQWDAAKGLGFVLSDKGGERLLLRRADLSGRLRNREPQPGEAVRFEPGGAPGQRRALQVHSLAPAPVPAGQSAPPPRPSSGAGSNRLLVIPAFALLLGALHLNTPLPRPVPLLYGALSMALFIIYGLDKWAARKGSARVAETSLHLVALLGGWPGALLGQQIFRHKTGKPLFLRLTWAMVALNLSLLVALWSLWR